MKNYISSGDIVSVLAPYALTSGAGCLVGFLFGVACFDAANGAAVEIKTEGVFSLTALTTDTAAVGAKLYWDNTNKRLTTTATSNTLVGVATVAKLNGDTTVAVYLDGAIR